VHPTQEMIDKIISKARILLNINLFLLIHSGILPAQEEEEYLSLCLVVPIFCCRANILYECIL
jgi:hypothetical protein